MGWNASNCARSGLASPRRRLALGAAGVGLAAAMAPSWAGRSRVHGTSVVPAPWRDCGLPAECIGLYARVLGERDPLVSLNAEHSFALASTAKLVTSMAALDLLGPQFRWRTFAFLDGELRQGRLDGDLWIVGGGDARLRSDDLAQWMAEWRALGLREIRGNIVLDRFAFHLAPADHASTPSPAADRPHHAWPDALTVDEGVLRISLRADAQGQARVSVSPPLAGLSIEPAFEGDQACAPTAVWQGGAGRRARLLLQGQWHAGCEPMVIEAALPHAEYSARAVAGLWARAGGRLRGRVLSPPSSERATLLPQGADGQALQPFSTHRSPALPELLRDMNKSSDNLAARHLMLALSGGFPVRSATLPEAQRRMRQWLSAQGLGPADLQMDTGSGLSRSERARPRALVQLLERASRTRGAQTLMDSLPLAGVDGTLAQRLRHGAAAGRAHLKTGTLLDTRALAGYVQGQSGRWVAVAALVNHPDAERALPSMDSLIHWLARRA